MFLVGIISWWYGNGWKSRLAMTKNALIKSLDFYSINLILRTLFSPYRQISAESAGGSIGINFRAMIDKLISRVVGFIVRSFVLIFGMIVIIIQTLTGVVIGILWLFIPLLPILGLIMYVIGWTPSWQ